MNDIKSKKRVADHGEVFTPAWMVEAMLDLVKEETERIESRFLEPACGTGNFLVKILQRKLTAVELEYGKSDFERRQYALLGLACIYGIELLADNIAECRAKALEVFAAHLNLARSDDLYHAASHVLSQNLVHGDALTMRTEDNQAITFAEWRYLGEGRFQVAKMLGNDVQFDVITGNPPYQTRDGGYGASATPVYQLFVEKALELEPRFAIFVTPSRWMVGGRGLNKYRERMLSDKRMRSIVDYPKLREVFPCVKIRGGISYFLWDRNHRGPCEVQTIWDGEPTGPTVVRYLDTYDILVRRNEAVPILEKVRAKGEPTLELRVSSSKPFGLPTFFHGNTDLNGLNNPVKLFGSQKISWVERESIPTNSEWVDKWKVLMTAVQGTSAAVETKFLSKPIIAEPGTACTETYLVAGRFDTETEAKNYAKYLRTRFARFLVSLRKSTQHATRNVYSFIPDLPLDREWTDDELYKRYGLAEEEIAFIESQVAEQNDEVRSHFTR